MKRYLPYGLLLVGLCLLIYGFASDEVAIIYQKAKLICLECIGIG